MTRSDLSVHGEWPDLNGLTCSGLVVEEYWHEGSIYNPASALWLRTGSVWHLLFLDNGEVFWRVRDEGPTAFDLPERG
jgi:hypothetical protein